MKARLSNLFNGKGCIPFSIEEMTESLSNFPKHGLHAYSFSRGLDTECMKHLWCAASATNCRKYNRISSFAGFGGCRFLCTDVNDAEQMRQEGVPDSLPFTFLLARPSAHTHT